MGYLYICNNETDSISKVHLDTFKEEKIISLKRDSTKVGPHGLYCVKNTLYCANCFGNSISRINLKKGDAVETYEIGMQCNDIFVIDKRAYIACGDCNSVIVWDIVEKKIIKEIPVGNYPHSLCYFDNLLVVTNMHNDSLTIIDIRSDEVIKDIAIGEYPIKVRYDRQSKCIYVCESYLGSEREGVLRIINAKDFSTVCKVNVGKGAADVYINKKNIYVSNISDGSVSFIDLNEIREVKRVNMGKMPRGIVLRENYLYVSDNFTNILYRYNIDNLKKEAITIGKTR